MAVLLCFTMAFSFTSCDGDSGSYDDGNTGYGNYENDNDDDYKSFMNDVDDAGNGDGKADWDDWNAYAEDNGYNKAY